MAIETMLVQMNKRAGSSGIDRIKKQIKEWKGEILIEIPNGCAMIISLDSRLREALEGLPFVTLVGGVQIQPPEVKRIRSARSK
ncbi:MAG: hypothetical protein JRH12_21470 [Deltaproteobacteria bacterium]|jgi:hypothetical protein|nr:hypothetical protein [Deltaproteobacteria bacterium]MBW2478522.1 hypothetical protein [Deltaproteobacteria bacterium]